MGDMDYWSAKPWRRW